MGILVIDPNGIRHAAPQGPLFFKLDSLSIKPGQTSKSGTFVGTINDNANSVNALDMTYLEPNTEYIRDNDEFWVGIQQGLPTDPIALDDTWVPGSGRKWIMGGHITSRYYKYEENTQITAVIEGIDYTADWRSVPFGTPEVPRDYTLIPTDVVTIVATLFSDVNQLMLPIIGVMPDGVTLILDTTNHNYQYTSYPGFPGALSGTTWTKNFQEEDAFSLMQNACEEIAYDWTIIPYPSGATAPDRRRLLFYPRAAFPDSSLRIAYDVNVREVPTVQVGSTEDLVTNILAQGSDQSTVPPNTSMWCLPTLWPDRDIASRRYSSFSFPPPPNPALTGLSVANLEPDPGFTTSGLLVGFDKWSDYTQVLDDDGMPGLNIRRAGLIGQYPNLTKPNRTFKSFLSFWTETGGRPQMTSMHLNLLEWRRLLFKFRHVTLLSEIGSTFGWAVASGVFTVFVTLTGVTVYDNGPDTNVGHTIAGVKWTAGSRTHGGDGYFLFEDGGGPDYDVYIEYLDKHDGTIEVWAGSNNTHSRYLTVYFRSTILTQGTSPMPAYHGILSVKPISRLIPSPPSSYMVRLHTNIDVTSDESDWDRRAFVYEFGRGNQEVNGLGLDTVNTQGWHDVNLLLPEIDAAGNVINWNGWAPEYTLSDLYPSKTANPLSIDCPSLEIYCGELTLDHNINGRNWMIPSNVTNYPDGRIPLTQNVAIGDYYLKLDNPERFFYRGEGRTILAGVTEKETLLYNPKPKIFLADANMENGEWVDVDAINGEYPNSCNIRLIAAVRNAYTVGNVNTFADACIWIPADHSFSISQFHFERGILDVNVQDQIPSNLRYPYRYKITSYSEATTPEELINLAKQDLSETGISIQRLTVKVDGDPRLMAGYLVQPQMDPIRESLFHNITMMIDDLEFVVDGTDFYCNLGLGTIGSRARGYEALRQQAAAITKMRKLEAGSKLHMTGLNHILV